MRSLSTPSQLSPRCVQQTTKQTDAKFQTPKTHAALSNTLTSSSLHLHSHTHTYTQARTHTHVHVHARTQTHTRARTHICQITQLHNRRKATLTSDTFLAMCLEQHVGLYLHSRWYTLGSNFIQLFHNFSIASLIRNQ